MAYERLDPRSVSDWIWGHADHMARYEWAARFVAGKRVLDAGTGTGYGAAFLLRSGASEVIGVDIEQSAVAEAALKFRDAGLTYKVADCENLNGIGSGFDVICSFENIEHLKKPRDFLAAAGRLLSPGGVLLCSTPDKDGPDQFGKPRPPNPYHVEEWTRAQFRSLILEYFEDVDLRVQVCTFACQTRLRAAESLSLYLQRLFFDRVTRRMMRLFGMPILMPRTAEIAASSPADFPIVGEKLVEFTGYPACHVIVCRNPCHL